VAEDGSTLLLVGLGELDLDSIDAVHAIDEEDKDEDEGNLHSILDFCDEWGLRDEGKHLSADCVWKRDDEEHEEHHLTDEQEEDETVIESHLDVLIGFVSSEKS